MSSKYEWKMPLNPHRRFLDGPNKEHQMITVKNNSVMRKPRWAIRHKAFECLLFVENRGPGVIEVRPKGVASRRLTPGRTLIDDARQEVLIDVIAGETADLILQPVCGGIDGLSEDVIAYFKHMNKYGYYRDYLCDFT
jgi:hypothetical protein